MTSEDFLSELFYWIDEVMTALPKHPLSNLWPSELGTLGILVALKGGGKRAFYRWGHRDWRNWFPALPERTRLCRLLATPRPWTEEFLAPPTVLGGVDRYGIELLPPRREGRRRQQSGRKGTSNPRGIVGGNLCLLLKQGGLGVGWDCAGANAPDTAFHPLIETYEEEMIGLRDSAFHAKAGDPTNRKLCDRGLGNTRRLVEPVLSMLRGVCHLKKVAHRTWAAFQTRLAFPLVTFNLLVQGHGLKPEAPGFIHLSLAEFRL